MKYRWLLFLVVILITFYGCASLNPKAPVATTSPNKPLIKAEPNPAKPIQPRRAPAPFQTDAAAAAAAVFEDEALEADVQSTPLDEALEFIQVAQEFWQHGELDKALESLDQAYALVLGVDVTDQPDLLQQKEDLRFVISRRILEIYASRHIAVNGTHNAIPLVFNEHVEYELKLLTTGAEKDFFRRSYKRSGRWRPFILAELEKAGMPQELSWLPLIESGFTVNALSPARALGLWQFIPSTGYKFGLTRNEYVDERLDPYKATLAAIEYMKELHLMFGDWSTVLAGYNCGENRVLRLIREQNINYLDDFWDLYQRLPRETARYVPRFLATLHIVSDPAAYGLDDIELDEPLQFEVVDTRQRLHLRDLAKALDISESSLKMLNPELRRNMLPGQSYALRIPVGTTARFEAAVETLAQQETLARQKRAPASDAGGSVAVHTIRRGETLSTIAGRYGVSTAQLARLNQLSSQHRIVAGNTLRIPRSASGQQAAVATTRPAAQPSQVINYTVRRGDSLWILAQRHQTTTRRIQDLNRLSSTTLQVGQTLRIPTGDTSTPPATPTRTYQVRSGDSPYVIAQRHRMPLDRFLALNQLTPRCRIFPGQTVYVE